jgi:hypothetical protein
MRIPFLTSHVLAGLLALTAVALSTDARADDEFDVSVAGGKVLVTAKGAWHINKDYPWKLTVGDAKLDKSKFEISEKTASVAGAPKGSGKLKGAVCSGDKCKNFEKEVSIP